MYGNANTIYIKALFFLPKAFTSKGTIAISNVAKMVEQRAATMAY
jgi:hypothetical protein